MAEAFAISGCEDVQFNGKYVYEGLKRFRRVGSTHRLVLVSFGWCLEESDTSGWSYSTERKMARSVSGLKFKLPPTVGWTCVDDQPSNLTFTDATDGDLDDVETTSEPVLPLWERLFDSDDKDVTFQCKDGPISAHKCVLRAASDAFKSALDHDMQERATGVINVPNITVQAMKVFLRVIYTGHVDAEDWGENEDATIPLELLLSMGDIAKRYMVGEVLSLSTQALKARLRLAKAERAVGTFEQIWAAAIAGSLDPIRLLAIRLVQEGFAELREAYDAKRLRAEVAYELEAVWPPISAPKRRRRLV